MFTGRRRGREGVGGYWIELQQKMIWKHTRKQIRLIERESYKFQSRCCISHPNFDLQLYWLTWQLLGNWRKYSSGALFFFLFLNTWTLVPLVWLQILIMITNSSIEWSVYNKIIIIMSWFLTTYRFYVISLFKNLKGGEKQNQVKATYQKNAWVKNCSLLNAWCTHECVFK